jgi:hypothetical protein
MHRIAVADDPHAFAGVPWFADKPPAAEDEAGHVPCLRDEDSVRGLHDGLQSVFGKAPGCRGRG